MHSKEVIKVLMAKENISMARIANAINSSKQNLWNTLKGEYTKSMGVDRLVKILNVFDYKLIAVPRSSTIKGYTIDEVPELSDEPKPTPQETITLSKEEYERLLNK